MFRKKRRNRRSVERAELLDVKLRTSQTRAHRMRLLGVVFAVVFSLTLAARLVWRGGSWLLDKLIYKNEAFAIRQIDIQTDGVISPNVIRYWAKVRPGQNLLALDLLTIKRNLEILPPIESVAVERVLPRTLKSALANANPLPKPSSPNKAPTALTDRSFTIWIPKVTSSSRSTRVGALFRWPLLNNCRS
jgi:cell division septal protein FtsQ